MQLQNPMDKLEQYNRVVKTDSDARKRLLALFDEQSFVELDAFSTHNGDASGVVTGYGTIDGSLVYAFSQDTTADLGAVSVESASKVVKVYELAAKTGAPIVGIYDSNGLKIDQGHNVLASYGQMLKISNNISGVVPQLAIIAGVCAGTAAMIAANADVVLMAKDAQFFLNAPFNTIDCEGAGSAENAEKAGCVSLVCDDALACVQTARSIISMLPLNNLAVAPMTDFTQSAQLDALTVDACPCETVAAVLDADSLVKLYPNFGQGATVALGTMAGNTVGVVYTKRKHALDSDSCAKIARFVQLCDAFSIPVITFVHTPGFSKSAADERDGSVRQAAKLCHAYAEATCPKISVITGNAVGASYIALAGKGCGADLVLAWPTAVISALEPETAVEFLWHDKLKGVDDVTTARQALVEEYKLGEASPFAAASVGNVDDIITPTQTRASLISALDMLSGKRVNTMPKKHSNIPL